MLSATNEFLPVLENKIKMLLTPHLQLYRGNKTFGFWQLCGHSNRWNPVAERIHSQICPGVSWKPLLKGKKGQLSKNTPLVKQLPSQTAKQQALMDLLLKSLWGLLEGTDLGFICEAAFPAEEVLSAPKSLNDGSVISSLLATTSWKRQQPVLEFPSPSSQQN